MGAPLPDDTWMWQQQMHAFWQQSFISPWARGVC